MTEVLVRDQPKNAGQLIQYGPLEADRAGVLSSYQSHFNYQAMRDGLRSAQRGAVAALQAHWTVSREPAVLVLPTGSGKTETMLTLLAEGLLDRLLVVVPWVPLRDQTVRKFGSMGLLRKIGILPPQAPNPVVAVGMHRFKSSTDVSELLDECNVFVANVQSIIGSKDEALEKLAEKFSHVFIDEAHHLAAPTWTALQNYFSKVPIVLFTATPFRRDGKKIDGKVIYNFPLRLAQEQGFFQPITFRPVYEFSKEKSDRAIAHEAVRVLRRDLELRLDHILLARADLVQRADDLLEVYQAIAPDLNPVVIHSNTKKLRKVNQEALNNRKSRILICVDMFGEGFDFAQLKVAALHDVHKSLAITLQFFGRFARAEENVGSATVVANLGEVRVEDALRELYAEDADWNLVLNVLSSTATGRVKRRSELLSSFPTLPDISIQNLFPKMSTTVFRTKCETWEPGNLASAWNAEQLYWGPSVSTEHCTAVAVIRVDTPVLWGEIKDLCNTQWHLFVLHWSEADKALFIYSSDKESLHEDVAATVCGEDCELLQGESVYRCFDGVSRVVLTNLGLNNHAGDSLSHEMLTGPDVGEAVSPQKLQKRTKTNVFGRGYDAQGSASRGCSTKGRIWSHRVADDISDWVDWCKLIGAKVLDETISEAAFLKGVMKTRKPTSRPPLVPLAIDWPLAVWKKAEPTSLSWNSNDCAFHNCELNLLNHEREGDILFEVASETDATRFALTFTPQGVQISKSSKSDPVVRFSRRTENMLSYFQKNPPTIYFEREAVLENGLLCQPAEECNPFDPSQIVTWDWGSTDLSTESMGRTRDATSIQKFVLDRIEPEWEIVFNDDEKGEIADLVALRRDGEFLRVRLVHCKWAIDGKPGARVKDLYEVCGQAQKSVRWRDKWEKLFSHLAKRQANWEGLGLSRLERGSNKLLVEIHNQARLLRQRFEVWIVQPGISAAKLTNEHLHLLASTENYLSDAGHVPLVVVGSP